MHGFLGRSLFTHFGSSLDNNQVALILVEYTADDTSLVNLISRLARHGNTTNFVLNSSRPLWY